jgi:L,D-peptidoglycan transpeptidase YkuD (ErfK/YbiS/YcfS/YnhG family)
MVRGYNVAPIAAGKGSAIFLHLHSRTKRGATKPTSGCVTVTNYQLTVLLKRLDPAKNPRVVIGPASWLTA